MRPKYRTLQQLRDSLAVSLGFGAAGGSQPNQIPILNEFLQQAQAQLWRDLRLNNSRKTHYESLGVNQEFLDVPDDMSVGDLQAVFWLDGDIWHRLHHGLPDVYDLSLREEPCYYGINVRGDGSNVQVQFYPVPCELIKIRMDYYAQPSRFTQNDDAASVPDDLLLTLAVVFAKAHYQQSDVQLYTSRFDAMLRKIKAQNFDSEGSRVCRTGFSDPYERPVKFGRG